MALNRRDFIQALCLAAVHGLPPGLMASAAWGASPSATHRAGSARGGKQYYALPRFGSVRLLHLTDLHAQLLPLYYREPSMNLGAGAARGHPPHLTDKALLRYYGIRPGTREAHAFTSIDFEHAAALYGRMGGMAHLATLVRRLRADQPASLLLDGGDALQGTATSLWTRGEDMVQALRELGVDYTTGHWEFTYGEERLREIIAKGFGDRIGFLAHNVLTRDFDDPVFEPYRLHEAGGRALAIIGQAFPYTPIAHPSRFVAEWTFGIQEENLQKQVAHARAAGAGTVVLLSHNGMDVDLKLASRVTGIDVILGGHTHDAVPQPVIVSNGGGRTLVTNAGSNGKFLGCLDLELNPAGRLSDFRYRLLPVFPDLLPADAAMSALITRIREPYLAQLREPLAQTEGLLYRRGNFNGSFDQLILDALMETQSCQIAFSPGFRWGTALLPGELITMEALLAQTAITYPQTTVQELTGAQIKAILEDLADNLFNPDPYYQQGGDMVRVGGMSYTIDPQAAAGARISSLRLAGKPMDADAHYRVAGWAPVADGADGPPVWEVVARWLRARQRVPLRTVDVPRIIASGSHS